MALVHTKVVADDDPVPRPAEVEFTDVIVTPYQNTFYRLVAVDQAGNVSAASPVVTGQAYDYGPPTEPIWERSEWVKLDAAGAEHPWTDTNPGLAPAVVLVFTTPQSNVFALAQRMDDDIWRSVTPWMREPIYDVEAGVWRFTLYDRTIIPSIEPHRYRARLISTAGVILQSVSERVVVTP